MLDDPGVYLIFVRLLLIIISIILLLMIQLFLDIVPYYDSNIVLKRFLSALFSMFTCNKLPKLGWSMYKLFYMTQTGWWLNHPSEKYARQIDVFPQIGMKIKHISHHQTANNPGFPTAYLFPPTDDMTKWWLLSSFSQSLPPLARLRGYLWWSPSGIEPNSPDNNLRQNNTKTHTSHAHTSDLFSHRGLFKSLMVERGINFTPLEDSGIFCSKVLEWDHGQLKISEKNPPEFLWKTLKIRFGKAKPPCFCSSVTVIKSSFHINQRELNGGFNNWIFCLANLELYHGNLRGPPPKATSPQEIAGLIKALLRETNGDHSPWS